LRWYRQQQQLSLLNIYVVAAVHTAAKILFPKLKNVKSNHGQTDFRPELISSLSHGNVEASRCSRCTIEFRAQQNPLQCSDGAQHPHHHTLDISLHSTLHDHSPLHSTFAKPHQHSTFARPPPHSGQQPAQDPAQHLCQTSPPHSGQQPAQDHAQHLC